MGIFRKAQSGRFVFATVLFCLGLLLSSPLHALDPQWKIRDLVHTSFTGVDFPFSSVRSLAQTKDGYLWLATYEGVFRFDGVRFTRFDPLSKASPRQLLATRDGGLWVVFDTGRVSRVLDGKVTSFPTEELPRATACQGLEMAVGKRPLRPCINPPNFGPLCGSTGPARCGW
jgi:ligand-binding sensor domain-containing protein